MQERVRGYADAVIGGLKDKDLAEVAAQLEAFSQVVAASEDLRTAFALPTTSPATRRAVVHDLLGKKAHPAVARLLPYAAQAGDGAELEEDVAALATMADARRRGMVELEEGILGRVSARQRVSGFAAALLEPLRDEKKLGDLEDELFRFMRIVEGNDDLRVALTTAELPADIRHGLVSDLLERRASAEATRMATYAVDVGRPRDYLELLAGLVDQVAHEAQRRVADVRSAIEMTEAEKQRLGAALGRLTGAQVEVRVTVEPSLLGGFVASVGDMVVDASLRHRLRQVREIISTPSPSPGGGEKNN